MFSARSITKALCLLFGCLLCTQALPWEGRLGAAAQQKSGLPSVAIMEPSAAAGGSAKTAVSAIDKFAVRGTLAEYLTRSRKYKVLDRARIDQIAKEQDFQRKGLVNQTTIKKMGEMMGADFICTLELLRDDTVFGVNVALIDVVTGETPFSSFEMTPNYSAMEVKNLAEAIGKKILSLDHVELAMREDEERAEHERAEAAERAHSAAMEKVRREAEEKELREAQERERRDAEERERRDAAERERRAVEETARREREAFEMSPTGTVQKIDRLMPFFDGGKTGALTNKALTHFMQVRQQAVIDQQEGYWHAIVVEIRKGELAAYSRYVCTEFKNYLNHNKISAEIDGKIISLPLVSKSTKSSTVGTFTEEAPINNIEWLRTIAENPGRKLTIRLLGTLGVSKEYVLSDIVHTAIIQTLELYDAQQRLKKSYAQ
jgi:hypothetical protein